VEIAAVEQCLHQHGDAADVVQDPSSRAAARLQIGDIRGLLADLAEGVEVEIDAGLVGDRRQV